MSRFNLTRAIRLAGVGSGAVSGDAQINTGPGPANGVTLSGPTSGTTGLPGTFTVTPNGVLASTVIVTPAATNAGSVSPGSLTFSAGSSAAQSFTVTRSTDGTSSVSITNNGGLSNLGSPLAFDTINADGLPSWLAGVPLNTWFEIPNTQPQTAQAGYANPGSAGAKQFITSFSGGYVWDRGIGLEGGGHLDYGGNENLTADLLANIVAWLCRRNPTPGVTPGTSTHYADGRPRSRHSSWNLQFIPQRNRLFMHGGPSLYEASGGTHTAAVDAFNFATNDWDPAGTYAPVPNPTGGGIQIAMPVCQDANGNVYVQRYDGSNNIYRWNQSDATWTDLGGKQVYDVPCVMAVDTTRNRILRIGGGGSYLHRLYDLNNNAAESTVSFTGVFGNTTPGCSLVYVPDIDRFLMFSWSANDVYEIHPTTFAISVYAVAGTKPPSPLTDGSKNLSGRFNHFPALKLITYVRSTSDNVWCFRYANITTDIVSFDLVSTSSGTKDFTIGQPFKQGDLPSGAVIGGDIALQVDVKNTWPDGSARFAIVSGSTTLTANVAKTIRIRRNGAATTGSALTTASLKATGITASIVCGTFGSVSWATTDWDLPFETWVSGNAMSSWRYRKPVGSDPHLVAWLEVRLYASGNVEVLPWIENGYLLVSGPAAKSATYTLTLNGSQRYSGAINLRAFNRMVLISGSGTAWTHWAGTDPGVRPEHNKAYLQQTAMVPTYRTNSTGASRLGSLSTTWSPYGFGDVIESEMTGGGEATWIGPMPLWDAFHLTASNDARTWASINAHSYVAGRYALHRRESATNKPDSSAQGRPIRISQYPNLVLADAQGDVTGVGDSTLNQHTPTFTGGQVCAWDIAHHPLHGYLIYLLTGRKYHAETLQFAAATNYLTNSDDIRGFAQGILRTDTASYTPRGAAWALRTLTCAYLVTPDGDPLQTEYLNVLSSNVDYYHAKYVAQANNPQGLLHQYEFWPNNGLNPSVIWNAAIWQNDWNVFAWGFIKQTKVNFNATRLSRLDGFLNWINNSITGRLGGLSSAEYRYADAGRYTIAYAPTHSTDWTNGTGPWYSSWGAIYQASEGVPNPGVDAALNGGNWPIAYSYWSTMLPAISYAVDCGLPGALTAYNRLVGASNWSDCLAPMTEYPTWAIKPRTV